MQFYVEHPNPDVLDLVIDHNVRVRLDLNEAEILCALLARYQTEKRGYRCSVRPNNEKTEFNPNKIRAIKAWRGIFGQTLAESKAEIDSWPKVVRLSVQQATELGYEADVILDV